jgi:sarcosine oxidase
MGFLRPENCVAAQLELAEKYGAEVGRNEKVLKIGNLSGGVEVITDKATYRAEKLIVSAGAWVNDFVETRWQDLFKVYRQVFYWFDAADAFENFKLGNFPIFIWEFGRWENDFIYGFPAIDGRADGFKIATETYLETTDPDRVNRHVSPEEIDDIYEKYIKNRLAGVPNKCLRTATCLYTVTPQAKFVIDKLPENESVILASPCSGHGFKHSAAIGEILAEIVTGGKSKIDISAFALKNSEP